jgi:hypothetical protein
VSKHSPGPWRWWRDPIGGARRLLGSDGRAIFWPVPDQNATAPGGMRSTDICVDEANARLIAAPPELLEALKEWSWRFRHVSPRDAQARLDALIRRIEGEEAQP